MCLLFFSYNMTPGYRLVMAANRDEFLSRPTALLGYIDPAETLLAGRDITGGGTWLGVSKNMKFGAITNYRDCLLLPGNPPSRGEILLDFLQGEMDVRSYVHHLSSRGQNYNGFNVVLGDQHEVYYYSNRNTTPRVLEPGFYGLSNHQLDTPWPKVVRGKKLLRPHMVECSTIDPYELFRLLEDRQQPLDEQLPVTGVGLEWERLLGTIFIESDHYGTRSSAVVTIDDSSQLRFVEKSYLRTKRGSLQSQIVDFTVSLSGES
ncbi:MAG: NRDE family protein [Desulforhopalus sp.]